MAHGEKARGLTTSALVERARHPWSSRNGRLPSRSRHARRLRNARMLLSYTGLVPTVHQTVASLGKVPMDCPFSWVCHLEPLPFGAVA